MRQSSAGKRRHSRLNNSSSPKQATAIGRLFEPVAATFRSQLKSHPKRTIFLLIFAFLTLYFTLKATDEAYRVSTMEHAMQTLFERYKHAAPSKTWQSARGCDSEGTPRAIQLTPHFFERDTCGVQITATFSDLKTLQAVREKIDVLHEVLVGSGDIVKGLKVSQGGLYPPVVQGKPFIAHTTDIEDSFELETYGTFDLQSVKLKKGDQYGCGVVYRLNKTDALTAHQGVYSIDIESRCLILKHPAGIFTYPM